MEGEAVSKKQLTPDLDDRGLIEYFRDKKPKGLDDKTLENLSCLGLARLIVGEFGGPRKARIYWLEDGPGDDDSAHAWVVKIGSDPKDKPYNNNLGISKMSTENATVEQLEREGVDRTEEILNQPWSTL